MQIDATKTMSLFPGTQSNDNPNNMTHDHKIQAAKTRVADAKSLVIKYARLLANAKKESDEATTLLESLLARSKSDEQNDNNNRYSGLDDAVAVINNNASGSNIAQQSDRVDECDGNAVHESNDSEHKMVSGGQADYSNAFIPMGAQCIPVSDGHAEQKKASEVMNAFAAGAPTEKRKYKLCNVIGCTNQAKRQGKCTRHGAKAKPCSYPGCNNVSSSGGVCRRHGAKFTSCSVEGCTTKARKGGLCRKHGGVDMTQCKYPDCTLYSKRGGYCQKHGGATICRIEGCSNHVQGKSADGVCRRHGAVIPRCKAEDCDRPIKSKGFCHRHWAEWKNSEGV